MSTVVLPAPTVNSNLTEDRSGRVELTLPTGERRERTVKLDLEAGRPVLLEIQDVLYCVTPGKVSLQSALYWIDYIPTDAGDVYRLRKFDAYQRHDGDEQYDVLLDPERPACECRGFLRHGHCKHVASLSALRTQGLV
jgi:hypothetical protein